MMPLVSSTPSAPHGDFDRVCPLGACPSDDFVARVLIEEDASASERRSFAEHVELCEACRELALTLMEEGAPVAASPHDTVMRTLSPGELICGRYLIHRFVDEGGMGEVYEAEDCLLAERVALKTVRYLGLADQRVVERFKAEVVVARRVSHPNVCRILEFGVHQRPQHGERIPFFTMPFLNGRTLASFLRQHGPMHVKKVRYMLVQIAAGLAAIHAEGVIHRDLKPDNVFVLDEAEDKWRLLLMDFGLARPLVASKVRPFSLPSAVVGTPAYLAPEVLQGQPASVRSDIYSVGVMAFEMLLGRRPFEGETPMDEAVKRLEQRAPRLCSFIPELPQTWEAFVARCLDPNERLRPADAAAFLAALPDAQPPRFARWQKVLALGLAMAAGGGGGLALWSDVRDVRLSTPPVPRALHTEAREVPPAPPPMTLAKPNKVEGQDAPSPPARMPRKPRVRRLLPVAAAADPDDVMTPARYRVRRTRAHADASASAAAK